MSDKRIYVGNLSYDIDDNAFKEFFDQYGNVEDASLMKDKFTGRLRGFGFVTYATAEEAERACEANGQELLGRELKVNIAQPRTEGGGRRGGGRNGGGRFGGRRNDDDDRWNR